MMEWMLFECHCGLAKIKSFKQYFHPEMTAYNRQTVDKFIDMYEADMHTIRVVGITDHRSNTWKLVTQLHKNVEEFMIKYKPVFLKRRVTKIVAENRKEMEKYCKKKKKERKQRVLKKRAQRKERERAKVKAAAAKAKASAMARAGRSRKPGAKAKAGPKAKAGAKARARPTAKAHANASFTVSILATPPTKRRTRSPHGSTSESPIWSPSPKRFSSSIRGSSSSTSD